MKATRTKRLKVPADTKHLIQIRDFAIKYGQKFGFNLRQLNGFKLSIDEICTNIIRYAYQGIETNGGVEIEIMRQDDQVITKISNWGVEFDHNSVEVPELHQYVKEGRKGGFGIYLVRQLNDEVTFGRVGNQNIITFVNNVESRPTLMEVIKQNFHPSQMTIRVRFGVIATIIISLVTIGTFFLASISQKRVLTRQFKNNYVTILKNFAQASADHILSKRELLITEQLYKLIEDEEVISRLFVIDRNGVIVADKVITNIGKAYSVPPGIIPLLDQEYLVQEYKDPQYGNSLFYSVSIRIADAYIGKAFLAMRKAELTKAINSRLNRLRILMYMIFFWGIGIVGVGIMGSMFITPIKKITEEINRLGKEGLVGGFHFSGGGEFAEISKAFDRMMREIKQSQVRLTDQARLKREMQLAQGIQQTLLPKKVPETVGFEIAAQYNAAMEVGGDYYDFFYVDENAIGITVGDVSGKGIGGAFVMSIVRTALRLEARGEKNASEVLVKLNSTLNGEMRKGMFITLFYIILDSKRRVINYASAGHTPMVLYRLKTNQIFRLNPKGFPIGLNLGDEKLFRKNAENEKMHLNKGDLLLIYTDGITEAMNPEREEYSEKRLLEFVRENNNLPVDVFKESFMENIMDFTRGYPQSDDITFIVIKEKKKYAELQYEKRMLLFDMIEKDGRSVKEACAKVGISRSTYYKLRKMREARGFEAIVPVHKEKGIKVLDFDISEKILEVIREYPEYPAKQINAELNTEKHGFIKVDNTLVYRELRRLKLSTVAKRLAYVKRVQGNNEKVTRYK